MIWLVFIACFATTAFVAVAAAALRGMGYGPDEDGDR